MNVQIGFGSPVPVNVLVSGNWPSTCAQLEELKQSVEKSEFHISLLTASTANLPNENCVEDSLPFKMSVPLNMTGLPAGAYTVTVNGARAGFEFPVPFNQDATVEGVEVRVSESSAQVNAIVRGQLPDPCWQVESMARARDGNTFRLTPVFRRSLTDRCAQVIAPFEQSVALDVTGLVTGTYIVAIDDVNVAGSTGTYTALVRGVNTTFTLPAL